MPERTVLLAVVVEAPEDWSDEDVHDVLRFRLDLSDLTQRDVDLSAVTLRSSRVRPTPAPGSAVHLLTGEGPGGAPGEVLVHVWDDGTGEVTYRPEPRATWGPPTALEPAP